MQEPCNVRLKHYKWNIAAILIFHFNTRKTGKSVYLWRPSAQMTQIGAPVFFSVNIGVMWKLLSSFVWCFLKQIIPKMELRLLDSRYKNTDSIL